MRLPNRAALTAGVALTVATAGAIAVGSIGMRHFDPALTGYAIGALMAAFAVGYRFVVWAQRPPSRMYFRRGIELFFRRAAAAPHAAETAAASTIAMPHGAGTLGFALARNFVAQEFIRRRGGVRWIMHLCLSGGCTLAFAITFPLVFGWIHFESFADNAEMYRVAAFGVNVDSFSVHSFKAFMMFNLLNTSAILVLIGLAMAGWRRFTDPGERATQSFYEDKIGRAHV